jgi:hypothetical protein
MKKEEANKIIKKFKFEYLAKLDEDMVLIKNSSRMNEKLRQL